jgi:predicted transcriptional regulator
VHVLRRVHGALRPKGLLLDVHPLGLDFAVRAGRRGLGFVDTRKFAAVVEAMNDGVEQTIAEELFEEVKTVRRHVAERFDDAAEALEEASSWEHLRLPAAVRRRLRQTDETPVEFIDTIRYRLLRKR